MDPQQTQPNNQSTIPGDTASGEANPSPKVAPQKNTPYSTQQTIPIAEIKDGIVVLKDGSFRVVVEAKAINFNLMNFEEQEAVEYAYQAFINSLYFPIQIQIQSRQIDAEAYIHKVETSLKQQKNMLLSVLTADYLDFLIDLIEGADIVDKNFYVIIPYSPGEFNKEAAIAASKNLLSKFFSPNKATTSLVITEQTLQEAKRELQHRLQTVTAGLRGCGIETKVLQTKDLIDLYYRFYNPEVASNQTIADIPDITAPVISKKQSS